MASQKPQGRRVLAAGTLVFRGTGKQRELLVVHRSLRADWSLPKGKLDAGELMPAAAVRETAEETTIRVQLRQQVGTIRYLSLGSPKLVRYWLAVPTDPAVATGEIDFEPGWAPNDEVDEIRWLRPEVALKLLSYPRDADVVRKALDLSTQTSPLILLRHAEAEKRAAFAARFNGNPPHDHQRPLTANGLAATPAIADALAAYGIQQVYSSPAQRCIDTVAPNFVPYDQVQIEDAISEFGFREHPHRARHRTVELMQEPAPLVIACHRPVLPTMVRGISRASATPEPSPKLKPGEFLVFHRPVKRDGRLRDAASFTTEHSADHAE